MWCFSHCWWRLVVNFLFLRLVWWSPAFGEFQSSLFGQLWKHFAHNCHHYWKKSVISGQDYDHHSNTCHWEDNDDRDIGDEGGELLKLIWKLWCGHSDTGNSLNFTMTILRLAQFRNILKFHCVKETARIVRRNDAMVLIILNIDVMLF